MSHQFRCSACRGRNVMPRHWREYKRPKRCEHCKAVDRFYVDKERTTRLSCFCSGAYHWIAHRPGSPMCERNPQWQANRARRQGESADVVAQLLGLEMSASATTTIPGLDEAPAVTRLHVAVVGMLWRATRLLETDEGLVLEAWIVQPGGGLPIVAFHVADPLDLESSASLRQRHLELLQVGTPVVARGFGIGPAVVDQRECLRIGLTSYVGIVPSETRERLAA